jgi:hypothetical protein
MIGPPNRLSGSQISSRDTYTSPSLRAAMDSPTDFGGARNEAK